MPGETALAQAATTTSEVLAFHLHWDLLGLVAFLGLGYWYGLRRLTAHHAPQGEPAVTRRQQGFYYSGLAVMFVVTSWPVHDIGESSLFTFHMIEHMALALVVPPLLLLGMPWWFMRLLVRPIMPAIRFATRPLIALAAFNATLAFLHWSVIVELMVTNQAFHFGAHLALFGTAVLMWWPVIGPIPDLPRLAPFPRMGYLFLQSLVPTIPASFLTLADGVVYPVYAEFPRLWGFDVHADQVVAGLIMKLGGGAVLWLAITIIFFTWFAEEERHERVAVATRV